MTAEVELKLLADGPRPLERLAAVAKLGDARLGVPVTFDEVDRYLDTADGRLAASGWACRLRERAGRVIVSIKGPLEASAVEWLHRRSEVEGPASVELDPAAWPPSPARELLESLSGGEGLTEQLRLRQRRTERAVVHGELAIGTLSLDEVLVEAAGDAGEPFWVVELELRAGMDSASAIVSSAADALLAVPGLVPDRLTKLERARAGIA